MGSVGDGVMSAPGADMQAWKKGAGFDPYLPPWLIPP
jgi:hypothetical protein